MADKHKTNDEPEANGELRRQQRLIEAIEVCRSEGEWADELGGPSLADQLKQDPQLRTQYERLRKFDARLAGVFREVSVPEGLQQRVLARLAASQAEQPADADQAPPSDVAPLSDVALPSPPPASLGTSEPATPATEYHPRHARRWAMAAISASLVAAAAMVWLGLRQVPSLSPQMVVEEAMQFQLEEPAGEGMLVAQVAPPRAFPFSEAVAQVRQIRWREVAGFLGQKGVAYDLPGLRGSATLYVVEETVAGLPAMPQRRPMHQTGGWCVSAWQEDGLLYVLVVRGSRADYRALIDGREGPIT